MWFNFDAVILWSQVLKDKCHMLAYQHVVVSFSTQEAGIQLELTRSHSHITTAIDDLLALITHYNYYSHIILGTISILFGRPNMCTILERKWYCLIRAIALFK